MRTSSNGLSLILGFIVLIILDQLTFKYYIDKYDYKTKQTVEELKTETKILKQEIRYLEEHVDCLHRDDKRFPCVVGDSHE